MGNDDNGAWHWNLTWRRSLFNWEVEEAWKFGNMLEGMKISPGYPNRWEWIHSKDGHYSTKRAYSFLTKEQCGPYGDMTFKRIWNPILPSKISAFNWQLLLDRIPTKFNLIKRGIVKNFGEGKCTMCKEEDKDVAHLFLKCKVVRWLWEECAK
ncbi:hypothetical protein SLEP1_g38179 [Rubroshorea leprosula]|uniref:Reverse transcriptase zinc-binding domain-containing protein n=1 Tax=Rubroshorea leprosula TaxID=152421 RepID=A0AAV5KXG9_9ROSI|nr:hypothetical protein SLEP1_g38179 [Rubroshorea leprosula]